MVAVRVEDVLALWREAERVRDGLTQDDPAWSRVSDEVADLAEIVDRLSATAEDTAAILAASGDRIALARRLIEQVSGSRGGGIRRRVVADLERAARVEIMTFPREDLDFRGHVLEAAQLAEGRIEAELLERVRESYPNAALSRAVDLAIVDGVPRFYVYRDGRYRSRCASPSDAGSVNASRPRVEDAAT